MIEYLTNDKCEKCGHIKYIIENIPEKDREYGLRVCADCYNEFHENMLKN